MCFVFLNKICDYLKIFVNVRCEVTMAVVSHGVQQRQTICFDVLRKQMCIVHNVVSVKAQHI